MASVRCVCCQGHDAYADDFLKKILNNFLIKSDRWLKNKSKNSQRLISNASYQVSSSSNFFSALMKKAWGRRPTKHFFFVFTIIFITTEWWT